MVKRYANLYQWKNSNHLFSVQIFFDYLVVATGSSYASQLKSTDVSVLYRATGLEEVNSELLNAKRVLIVGKSKMANQIIWETNAYL